MIWLDVLLPLGNVNVGA